MKLLIVTQTVDSKDPILGFFVGWIREFGRQCEEVHVLALNVGDHDLPDNVTVHCLGKSEGSPKIVWLWRLWYLSIKLRHQYDKVFVHMNPEYVIFGAASWFFLKKRIMLWYAHGATGIKLKFAHVLVDEILSSTKNGFSIDSKKARFVGQGIDTNVFVDKKSYSVRREPKFVTWGRVSKVKGVDTLIEAFARIKTKIPEAEFTIIGDPITPDDKIYLEELKDLVLKKGVSGINFTPGLPMLELAKKLQDYSFFIQNGKTGSLDKALLEAILGGLVTFSSNRSFKEFVGNKVSRYSYTADNDEELATKIVYVLEADFAEDDLKEFQRDIIQNHSLPRLVEKILN